MNEIFLVVWLFTFSGICVQAEIDSNLVNYCPPEIQSQTVSTESELNKLYQEHKDDGVRVWKLSQECGWTSCEVKFPELEFVSEPCGKWKEK